MTGGIYDHLLIIGTFCSFIIGMTNAWLLHNFLIPTFYEILRSPAGKITRPRESSEILGRELLASGSGFTRPGTPDAASPRSLKLVCLVPCQNVNSVTSIYHSC